MKKSLLLLFSVLASLSSFSQNVAINSTGALPNASAMLDITSTTSGLLIPRMTTAQRTAIAAPANGLLVFDTNLNCTYMYLTSTASWRSLCDSYGLLFVETTTLFNPAVTFLLKTLNVTTASATDRVLIEAEFDYNKNGITGFTAIGLYRNGVEIHEVAKYSPSGADNSIKLSWVDVPPTTGVQTYTLRYYQGGGGTVATVYGSNLIAAVSPQ